MASKCCVPMCNSRREQNPEVSFHKFPAESEMIKLRTYLGNYETVSRRKVWISKLKISKKVSSFMRVCSLHFAPNDFFRVRQRKNLKKTAIPSAKLSEVLHGPASQENVASSSRGECLNMRIRNPLKEAITDPITEEFDHMEDHPEIGAVPNENEIQDAIHNLLPFIHSTRIFSAINIPILNNPIGNILKQIPCPERAGL